MAIRFSMKAFVRISCKIIIYCAIFGVAYWATGYYDKKLLEEDPIEEFLVIVGLFSLLPNIVKMAGDEYVINLRKNFLKNRIVLAKISRGVVLIILTTTLVWAAGKIFGNDDANRIVWSLMTIIFTGYVLISLVLLLVFSREAARTSNKTSNK